MATDPSAPRRKAPPPVRDLRAPKLKLPPGACDTHFHFLGPQAAYPFNPSRTFVPDVDHEDSTIAQWQAMQKALGLSRGLLVWLRCVVCPTSSLTDREFAILTRAGVVGARFTTPTGPEIDDRLVRRTHEFGWSMHYLLHGEEHVAAWRKQILASPGKFVIEHCGNPPTERGIDGPAFKFVLECLDTGRCWVKLGPRFSKEETLPFADVVPFVKKLVAYAPSRCLWSSDWPHPQYWKPMPSDSDLLDLMLDWVPDEATRTLACA
jgi:2-pyrone-4,6-dicarboxylate lactonase